ncbi:MAG TPA: hypothetical protein VHK24_15245 [Steroidobacter sp.]|nr:hypothetical protein [Steroidobacter sp.]
MRDLRIVLGLALALACANARSADVKVGKAIAEARCSQCHEADDWDGEEATSLESLMRDIAAGKVKHKTRLDLSPAEIANVAAYWAESSR